MRHHVFYGGVIENPGEATTLYLKVVGRVAPGVPFSGTSTQTVRIEVPTDTSAFSFEGTNLPYPHVCAALVQSPNNAGTNVSNEVCTYADGAPPVLP